MKSHSVNSKTTRKTIGVSSHHSTGGENAVALAPPAYGIEFVDQRLTANAGPLLQGKFAPVQRQGVSEAEKLLQGKFATVQRQRLEEEDLLQGKFAPVQRQGGPEEDELLQGKFAPLQRTGPESDPTPTSYENNTGLPDNLKSGIEALSGMSMDNVKVHFNSSQPAQLNAMAYAQGSDIHVAPGQEQHLPHEAWHAIQQAQGRVQPTMQMKDGVRVNDDQGLEHEADVMGAKAVQMKRGMRDTRLCPSSAQSSRQAQLWRVVSRRAAPIQLKKVQVPGGTFDTYEYTPNDGFSKGADISLHFTGSDNVGMDGDTISLVQTVRDTTKLVSSITQQDITPKPTTSQLGNRVLGEDDAYAEESDRGYGIDQEVMQTGGDVVNLDPRYTEQRMDDTQPINLRGRSSHLYSVKSAQKNNGVWTKAQLNDQPAVTTRINRVQHSLTGGMDFEVAALHNESSNYLGSIGWGWRMEQGHAVLDPAEIRLVDAGGASKTFHRAAKKWNETDIVSREGEKFKPMQLPVDESTLVRKFSLDKLEILDLGNVITNQTELIVRAVEAGKIPKLKKLIITELSMTPELRGRLMSCAVEVVLTK